VSESFVADNSMVGLGAAPEAIETNPLDYDLLWDHVFRTEQKNIGDYVERYVERRYKGDAGAGELQVSEGERSESPYELWGQCSGTTLSRRVIWREGAPERAVRKRVKRRASAECIFRTLCAEHALERSIPACCYSSSLTPASFVQSAWSLLLRSAYNSTESRGLQGAIGSIFAPRPAFNLTQIGCCASLTIYYDAQDVIDALGLLIEAGDKDEGLQEQSSYRFEVINVAVQVLSNEALSLYGLMNEGDGVKGVAENREYVRERSERISLTSEHLDKCPGECNPRLLLIYSHHTPQLLLAAVRIGGLSPVGPARENARILDREREGCRGGAGREGLYGVERTFDCDDVGRPG